MTAWYVVWLTRYGNPPVGCCRWNSTVYGPFLTTPDGARIPLKTDAAADVAPVRTLYVATTSSAVSAWPLWKWTPLRIWNVQTVAVLFGFQLVASHGCRCRFGSENVRNSPGMLATPRPPSSASLLGSGV